MRASNQLPVTERAQVCVAALVAAAVAVDGGAWMKVWLGRERAMPVSVK